PGDVRIDYPPTLKRGSNHMGQDEYQDSRQKRARSNYTSEDVPWHPFKTRTDFDFVEFAADASLTKDQISTLLRLIRKCVDGSDQLTFGSYQDLHASWKEAYHLVEPFVEHPIDQTFEGEGKTYLFYSRSLWDWGASVASCVQHAELCHLFTWDAQKVHIFSGEKWERVYTDPWTGDDWFQIQNSLPDDGVPLMFILYADKTQLSSFGTAKAYPVYAKLANLPSDVTNGKGLGGGRLVGWLPIIKDDPKHENSPEWVDFKKVTGCWVKCGDGVERRIFPCILILSADFEEQVVMAGIRGLGTAYPCPVCLVPKSDLALYTDEWEYRDAADRHHLGLIVEDPSRSAGARKKAAKALEDKSFRPMTNAFSYVDNSDPHRGLGFDRLHNYPGGLAKTHILNLLFHKFKKANKTVNAQKALIEKRAANFPRWQNLTHFHTILTDNAYQDSNKWEDMARVLLYTAHGVFPQSDKTAHQLLRLLRCFLNLNAYSSFERHSDTTLESIRNELRSFFAEVKKHGDMDKTKSWKAAPKVHMHVHMPHDIMGKGVTKHYSTKTFEVMHKPLKVAYLRMNFKDVSPQILESETRSSVIKYIPAEIEGFDAEVAKDKGKVVEEEDEDQHQFLFGNIQLKAPTSNRGHEFFNFSFDANKAAGPFAPALKAFDFTSELRKFLIASKSETHHRVGGQKLRIQMFRSLEVTYASLETLEPESNILRCSSSFHGRPRFDCVVINVPTQPLFARLISLFVLKQGPDDGGVPIALVIPYDGAITAAQRREDGRLGLHRVAAKGSGLVPEFVFARTIICGTLLAPANDVEPLPTEYFAMDVIDGDMFLRVRELTKASQPAEASKEDLEEESELSEGEEDSAGTGEEQSGETSEEGEGKGSGDSSDEVGASDEGEFCEDDRVAELEGSVDASSGEGVD
ncbi:hypothetical protein FA13DRAFT_1636737, partial [Coprinellus micaceus]